MLRDRKPEGSKSDFALAALYCLLPPLFAFLTLRYRAFIIPKNSYADVAKLADAQVSEACGSDTVVVQIHSSALRAVAAAALLLTLAGAFF